jgi:hypothetical protein
MVAWAEAPANEMIVLALSPKLDASASSLGVDTLYTSTDYGVSYAAAKGIDQPIYDAAFSVVAVPLVTTV